MRRKDREMDRDFALRLICQRHAAAGMDGFDDAIKRSLGRTAVWQIEITDITGKCKK